jgi:hypothetical protein
MKIDPSSGERLFIVIILWIDVHQSVNSPCFHLISCTDTDFPSYSPHTPLPLDTSDFIFLQYISRSSPNRMRMKIFILITAWTLTYNVRTTLRHVRVSHETKISSTKKRVKKSIHIQLSLSVFMKTAWIDDINFF